LAKEKKPSIIFIDELDAIGTKRFDSDLAGDREVTYQKNSPVLSLFSLPLFLFLSFSLILFLSLFFVYTVFFLMFIVNE
jgi:hypothetical protein